MKIIGVINHKGGVAKTTTAVNLAAGLAKAGKRVLLIDLDPQGHASYGVGYDIESVTSASPSMAFVMGSDQPISDHIIDTRFPNLKLAPADVRLAEVAAMLVSRTYRESILTDALEGIEGFDYIIIDTQPTLDTLPQNALAVADRILVPTTLSTHALMGLTRIIQTINKVKRHPKEKDFDWRIVFTRVKGHGQDRQTRAREELAPVADRILKSQIRETEAVEKSQEGGDDEVIPLILQGGSNVAVKDYRALVQEVLELWPA
ncbi:ParA family protein [bacterium]|nr:MAG: ParA family protein [bacterium]